MGGFIFALVMIGLVVFMLAMGIRSIKIQHEGKIGLVEAWGRFARVIVPGRYIIWPWEHVVAELPLQIFEYETSSQKVVLKGGSPLTLSAIIYYQIEHAHKTPGAPRPARIIGTTPAPIGTHGAAGHAGPVTTVAAGPQRSGLGIDSLEPGSTSQAQRRGARTPATRSSGTAMLQRILGRNADQLDIHQAAYRAQYMVHNWREATEKEAVATLQQVFSKVGAAEDIFGDVNWQETLGERVREHLNEKTERWGVQILDVVFKDLGFSEMTLQNIYAEPRAEREGRIRTKEAENYRRIAEMLNLTPAQLLSWRQVEIMRELAKSPQPRVMFTTDAGGHNFGGMPVAPGLMPGAEAPAARPQDLRGYLGSEPPPPALGPGPSAGSLLTHQTPTSAVPVMRQDGGQIAPGIQNIDQQ